MKRLSAVLARVVMTGVLAGAAGAAAVVSSSPASAATFDGSCGSGEVCVYYFQDLTGAMADFYDDIADYSGWHFWNSSLWLNDNVMSARNKAGWHTVLLYRDANYRVLVREIGLNGQVGSLYPYNNVTSSHEFCLACVGG
jgi:hypothetical protein